MRGLHPVLGPAQREKGPNKVGLFQLAGLSKDVVHLCSHGAFQDARSEYLIIGDEGFERERMYHEISLPSGTTYAKPASVPL